MQRIVVWGGGELGATLVRRIAERALAREVVVVEADESRARGKALDLAQSGPVEGYDTRVVGAGSVEAAGPAQVVVAADAPELDGSKAALDWLVRAASASFLLCAGSASAPLLQAAVNRGFDRQRVLGSEPVAVAAALRRAVAAALEVAPSTVRLGLLGRAERWIVPAGSATVDGVSVEALAPMAVRNALREVSARPRGPVALAAAAAHVLHVLAGTRDTLLPATVVLAGELGRRGDALAVPVRLGGGRIRAIVEPPLEPVDRIALDNVGARRTAVP